ncbi:hypothetical protein ACFSZS_25585 [Seohaeicola zhoushanensis]
MRFPVLLGAFLLLAGGLAAAERGVPAEPGRWRAPSPGLAPAMCSCWLRVTTRGRS